MVMSLFSFQKTLDGSCKRFPLHLLLLQLFRSCWQEAIIFATGAFRRGNEVAFQVAAREHATQKRIDTAFTHQVQFPVIHVIGRTDEILTFPLSQGGTVQILPLALLTVAEETSGLTSCQLIQTEPLKLLLCLSVQEMEEKQQVWEARRTRLETYLAAQRIANVVIEQAPEPPQLHPRSGKFQHVWSEVPRHLPERVTSPVKGPEE
jgi:hypothetical protein